MSEQSKALVEAVKRRRLANEAARALAKEVAEAKEAEEGEQAAPPSS